MSVPSRRNTSRGAESFASLLGRSIRRRDFLTSVAAGGITVFLGDGTARDATPSPLGFKSVSCVSSGTVACRNELTVAEGYTAEVLLAWGDHLHRPGAAITPGKMTAEEQRDRFGYNCDYVGFLPLEAGNPDRGLLFVNHEYTNPELMFSRYRPADVTREQIEVELAAHGFSVVEVRRKKRNPGNPALPDHVWEVVHASKFNRRITALDAMDVSGPAAGHPLLLSAGGSAAEIRGTLNNCGGGKTPWNTVLSAEENFQDYFADLDQVRDATLKVCHTRYGLAPAGTERNWEKHHARFDLAREPHEPFRFGWVLEVDPLNPAAKPVKRTALGRFRHEAATVHVNRPDGRVVVYSGDDARFEYVYRFVSAHSTGRAGSDRPAILDEGVLSVARFHADGTGVWVPLVHASAKGADPREYGFPFWPLNDDAGFKTQGDILVHTRLAADRLRPTPMDRPEDIEVNPRDQKVYLVMTNNPDRGVAGHPDADFANPVRFNKTGHIIVLSYDRDDHTQSRFHWSVFLLCGRPAGHGFSPIASPDNITFDPAGNVWIATDGAPKAIKSNDGLFAIPLTDGSKTIDVTRNEAKELKQFLSAPYGAEVCGPEFTPDGKTLFVAIQHPGEAKGASTFDDPACNWPDGGDSVPRPSVVAIQANDGRVIGS